MESEYKPFVPYLEEEGKKTDEIEQPKFIPNPNTSVHADITSHLRSTAEVYEESSSGDLNFVMANQSKIKETQKMTNKLRQKRKLLQRKYIEKSG